MMESREIVLAAGTGSFWRPFRDGVELRLLGFTLLADRILPRAQNYALSPLGSARLLAWRSEVQGPEKGVDAVTHGEGRGERQCSIAGAALAL